MYLVISRWKPKQGRDEEFQAIGSSMRAMMRSTPGVTFIEGFIAPDAYHVVHAYEDEATYRRIVDDPNGPFAAAAAAHKIDDVAEWLGSVSGTTVDR